MDYFSPVSDFKYKVEIDFGEGEESVVLTADNKEFGSFLVQGGQRFLQIPSSAFLGDVTIQFHPRDVSGQPLASRSASLRILVVDDAATAVGDAPVVIQSTSDNEEVASGVKAVGPVNDSLHILAPVHGKLVQPGEDVKLEVRALQSNSPCGLLIASLRSYQS